MVGQSVGELLGVANNLQANRLPEIGKEKVRELMNKMMANCLEATSNHNKNSCLK